MSMSVLGDRLRAERLVNGWTLEQVAEFLVMAKSTVHNHEKGACEPDLETLKRYAQLYRVSMSYLMGETDLRPLNADGIDADIALRVTEVSPHLTPEAKTDLLKAFDWIERDIRERKSRGNL